MTRKLILLALALATPLWFARSASADVKAALAGVPAEAAGFVCFPNLKVLDADVQQAIDELGLGAQLPPPMNSVVTMLKSNLPMLAGLDESKPVTYVIMPIQTVMELEAKSAFIFSTADPKAMLEGLGGTAGDNGIWNVNFMGLPWLALIDGKRIVAGKVPATLEKIAKSSKSVTSQAHEGDLAAMSDLDLIVWLDGERLFTPLKGQINGMLMMMLMQAQSQSSGMTPDAIEQTKKSINEMVDGMKSAMFGVTVQEGGIGLRGTMSGKPGTAFGEKMKSATTKGPLLSGIPAEPYMLAFGQVFSAEQAKIAADEFKKAVTVSKGVQGLDEEKLKAFMDRWTEAVRMYRGMRVSIQSLEPGPDGLIGLTKIVDVTNADKVMDLMNEGFAAGKALVNDAVEAADPGDSDMVSALLNAVNFELNKEQVAGTDVAQFKFDLGTFAKVGDVDEEEVAEIKKVVGQEGLLFRAAALDENTLVIGFGGGKSRFASALSHAKGGKAPLSANAGIQKVSAMTPQKRSMVAYVAPDQIVTAIQNVMRAVGEDPLPVQFPKPSAPIMISSTGSDGWSRGDLFVPIDILRTAMNAMMASAVAGGSPGSP